MEGPRETAITTAVNFLNNPKVARSTLVQKRNFLARKGLTDEEIQLAFEKVGIFVNVNEMNNNNQDETRIQIPTPPYKYQMTTFEKIKDMVSSAALISGIVYGIYMFYKKFIEPLLFGRRKKNDKIDDLAKTTKAINGELIRVREEINRQKQTQEAHHKVLQNSMQAFKSEIDTIKGILLNRKQFASPGSGGIPSWQLSKKKNQEKKDKHDDAGSAHSNSSENDTEVIPEESQKRSPANSDSSLEIM